MIQLREFTKQGRREFREFLKDIDGSKSFSKPEKFNRDPYSKPIDVDVQIDEERVFKTRLELGEYLQDVFDIAGMDRQELVERENLWTWLAYIWLEQFVGERKGKVNVKQMSKYVCKQKWNRYYKHLVALPYYSVNMHGKENSKVMLMSAPDVHKDMVEGIAGKRKIISNRSLVSICYELYWDEENEKVKTNADGRKEGPGTVRRLGTIIKQFRKTYDLHEMDSEHINSILPSEFDKWRDDKENDKVVEESDNDEGDSPAGTGKSKDNEDSDVKRLRNKIFGR